MKEDIKGRKIEALIHVCQCFLCDLFKNHDACSTLIKIYLTTCVIYLKNHFTCSILIKTYHTTYSFIELKDNVFQETCAITCSRWFT